MRTPGDLLVRGGRVVDPATGLDAPADVLVRDGKIARVGGRPPSGDPPGVEVVDASGKIVAPGFLDMHVHLREPGKEESETIETGCRAAVAGGFTSVAAMPNTHPVNDDPALTAWMVSTGEALGLARVHPIGAVSRGLAGETLAEMGEMRRAGAVAFSDDGHPVWNTRLLRRALEYASALGIPVIDHCEDPHLKGDGVMHEGEVSTCLGLRGIPAECETAAVLRDCLLAARTGGRLHVAHLSTAASLEAVREAKRKGAPVSCEVTPHHLLLTDEACRSYDTSSKMNPPLRTAADAEALRRGLADGTVDVIATDHAPHDPVSKEREFDQAPFGVVGLETCVALCLDRLVGPGLVTLPRLVELLSTNPARLLGLHGGTLAEGAPGDLTILDPARRVAVRPEEFRSKSRNTPFAGWELKGGPWMTVVGGRIVWSAPNGPSARK